MPHWPQLALSVAVSVQKAVAPVPHRSGVSVGHAQVALLQLWPAGQGTPQAPQLLASIDRSAQ